MGIVCFRIYLEYCFKFNKTWFLNLHDVFEWEYSPHSEISKHTPKITKDQYNIFNDLYKKYEDKLLEYMERFEEWNDESCNVIFWYGVYDSEEEKDILFSKEDCKIIEDIVKKTSLII